MSPSEGESQLTKRAPHVHHSQNDYYSGALTHYPGSATRPETKTKFYVGRIHTDTQEKDLSEPFSEFGEIYEVKIIKKSYNGQPLRDTYFAFVVIWLKVEPREVIEFFEKNYKEKGWNVSLAKEVLSFNTEREG